eukprot:222832_1
MMVLLLVSILFATANAICAKTDIKTECNTIIDIGKSLHFESWNYNDNWMSNISFCKWYGIKCNSQNQTVNIELSINNIIGSIPSSISNLTMLSILDLYGNRPSNYYGCTTSNLQNTSLPETIYNLKHLTKLDLEYTCLGGILNDKVGNLLNLEYLKLHGNFVTGTIPLSLDNLINLIEIKFGRNPMNGTIPTFKNMHPNVTKYCGNFCAFSGQFPSDILDKIPNVNLLFWDGNNFSGTLPQNVNKLQYLTGLSFNINNLNGAIPETYCDMDINETDCRIGHDTNYTEYQAQLYPWIIPVNGNLYDCKNMPKCITGSVCNSTDSPVICK